MKDKTENIRKLHAEISNSFPLEKAELEKHFGKVWDTKELSSDFHVIGFMAPYIVVERKSDKKKGSLEFQHSPRLYWNFREH